jgi:hypothetical protein
MADIVNTVINTAKVQAENLIGMFIPLVVGSIVVGIVKGMAK